MNVHPVVKGRLDEIIALCRRHHVRRLALFGSALDESFEPARSDIDLLIDFEEMTPGDHADAYFGLIFDLEDALKRPVDIVERSVIRNPYFRRAIDEKNLLLYDAA